MGLKCCERPSGNNVFGPMLFTTIAFILSNSGTRWCDYLYRQTLAFDSRYPWFGEAGDNTNIGFQAFQGTSGGQTVCYLYPSNLYVDTKFNTAYVMSIWTSVMGGIIMIIMWFTSCWGCGRLGWSMMGFFLMINCIFEGITLILKSSVLCDAAFASCTLARGSRCGISAIVFWFLAGASVATVPAPKGPEPIVLQQTTTTTTTENPDGTKTTTTKTETHQVPPGGRF